MISIDQAGLADEFHSTRAGRACSVWTRSGPTHYGPGEGQFITGVISYDEAGYRMFCSITNVNAGDFHTALSCPRIRSGQPGIPPDPGPMLASDWRDYRGRDALGFDARGFDTDGYDEDGYDELGYNRAGYDDEGYNRPGYNTLGYNRDGYNRDGYDSDGYNQAGFDSDGCNRAGNRFCEDCQTAPCECTPCDRCGDRFADESDLYSTLDGSDVCADCRYDYYSWCEDCDGWYGNENYDAHRHDDCGDSCCISPQLAFKIRNDGCEPLANNTRVTVALPAGVISTEGLSAIRDYLQRQGLFDLAYDMKQLGDQWQTKNGNFTRRLSRLAYLARQAKLSQDVLSQVGCIARDHSKQAGMEIEVTRDLNQSAKYFYHGDSCWWGSYSFSRCALKTNGGFGLRSFKENGYVSGRAWILPLRHDERGKLTPTFDTETPDAFVVFNGYGDLEGYAAPRILAHMAGWTYRKIGFDCSPMYINAGGYLVAPEHIAEPYTDGSLSLSADQHSHLFDTERGLINAQ